MGPSHAPSEAKPMSRKLPARQCLLRRRISRSTQPPRRGPGVRMGGAASLFADPARVTTIRPNLAVFLGGCNLAANGPVPLKFEGRILVQAKAMDAVSMLVANIEPMEACAASQV